MEIIIYYILNRLTLVYRVITTRKRCSVNYRFIENCSIVKHVYNKCVVKYKMYVGPEYASLWWRKVDFWEYLQRHLHKNVNNSIVNYLSRVSCLLLGKRHHGVAMSVST